MKKCLLIFAVSLPSFAFGQATKFVTKQNTNEYNIEKYNVLESDNVTKHGAYKMVNFFGGEPIKSGYYKMGKKDSVWKEYSVFGEVYLQATGKYKNDKKVGVWTYYCAKK